MTQEFSLSVTPVQDDTYLVRTERVWAGVPLAEEIVTWPVEAWLAQASQLMNDPLLGLLRGRGQAGNLGEEPASGDLVNLGQQLYNALFQGTVRDSWMVAQGIAQNQQDILRLRLGLKGDRLPRLPWEVLHAGDRPLSTGTDVVFSRYHSAFTSVATKLTRSPGTTDPNQPLRILMVLAAPTDQEVLQLHQEALHLQAELQRDRATGRDMPVIELTILDQPGREQLTQALEQGHYDILHYAGHSNLGSAGGNLYLVNNKTGLTEVLNGDDLAGLLVNNGVRVAVFNSCRGVHAATATDDMGNNLTDALMKRGVPAVLAMAERIPDDVALNLSRLFYRNLKQRYPIDLSLNRARQGLLSSYGSNQIYWALPILYLHPEFDGYLRSVQPGKTAGAIDPVASLEFDRADLSALEFVFEADGFDPREFDPNEFAEELILEETGDDDDRAEIAGLFKELSGTVGSAGDAAVAEGANATVAASSMAPTKEPAIAKTDAQELNQLGQVLQNQGDLTGAIAAYGDALKLAPNEAGIYYNLGTAFQAYGNLPEALTSYKMALRLDPQHVQATEQLKRLTGDSDRDLPPSIEQTPSGSAHFGQSNAERTPWPWRTIATVGVSLVALGSIGVAASQLLPKPPQPTPTVEAPSSPTATAFNPNANATDTTATDTTENLVAIATQAFNRDQLRQAQDAVEALINRGALVQAEAALSVASPQQQQIPAIGFLRGRLSWQFVQQGNRTHSVDDARRSWARVVKAAPKNALYQNALGFAYYAEGDLSRATDAWFEAADLVVNQPNSSDALTAYAGLALSAWKAAQSKTGAEQKRLQSEAMKLRDRVMKASPQAFSPEGLAQNWLWTEQMIADWKQLQALK